MPVKKKTSDIVSPRENMNYNTVPLTTAQKKSPSGNKRDDVWRKRTHILVVDSVCLLRSYSNAQIII